MDEKELDQMRKIVKELTKELKATAIARKPVDVESYLKTKIKNVQEEIARIRKKNKMSLLISQLENGERSPADLSPTEMVDLKSYIDEMLALLEKQIQQHPDASVTNKPILGDDIPKAADDVAPEVGGPSFRPSDGTKKTYEGESSKSGGADDDA